MAYDEVQKKKAFDKIIDGIETGESLRSMLAKEGAPSSSTFFKWLDQSEEMAKRYARADKIRADVLFDQLLEIAFTTEEGRTIVEKENGTEVRTGDMLGHRRLKTDVLKWAISKMNSKKYGDKIDHTTDGEKINQTIKVGYGKKDLDSYEDLL